MDFYERVAYRKKIEPYLRNLAKFWGRRMTEEDLLPLEETKRLKEDVFSSKRSKRFRIEREFTFLASEEFQALVRELIALNDSKTYLWLPDAIPCGLPQPVPLDKLCFSFDFHIFPEGILSVLTDDGIDRVVIDWFEEHGLKRVEVDLEGENWGRCRAGALG